MRFENLVVAIDFSGQSVTALRRARTLLGKGKTIHLVHILDPLTSGERGGTARKALLTKAKEQLDELIAKELGADLQDDEGWAVERHVGVGRPAEALLAAARKCEGDLVVIGSHARGKLARSVLGSVAEELARISEIPVLVVRERAEGGAAIERVVLAVDGSGPARLAVRVGLGIARPLGAKVEAISVIDSAILGDAAKKNHEDVPAKFVAAAGQALPAAMMTLLGGAKLRYVAGDAADELCAEAKPTDLVVCGTHGRSALGRLAFGSVATKLIRNAPCPVLVVRPPVKVSGPRRRS